MPGINGEASQPHAAETLAEVVARLGHEADLPSRLSECGIDQNKLPELAADAAKQWTATFNPRKVDAEELLRLYERRTDPLSLRTFFEGDVGMRRR